MPTKTENDKSSDPKEILPKDGSDQMFRLFFGTTREQEKPEHVQNREVFSWPIDRRLERLWVDNMQSTTANAKPDNSQETPPKDESAQMLFSSIFGITPEQQRLSEIERIDREAAQQRALQNKQSFESEPAKWKQIQIVSLDMQMKFYLIHPAILHQDKWRLERKGFSTSIDVPEDQYDVIMEGLKNHGAILQINDQRKEFYPGLKKGPHTRFVPCKPLAAEIANPSDRPGIDLDRILRSFGITPGEDGFEKLQKENEAAQLRFLQKKQSFQREPEKWKQIEIFSLDHQINFDRFDTSILHQNKWAVERRGFSTSIDVPREKYDDIVEALKLHQSIFRINNQRREAWLYPGLERGSRPNYFM